MVTKDWKKTGAPGCIHKFAGKAVRVKKEGGKRSSTLHVNMTLQNLKQCM